MFDELEKYKKNNHFFFQTYDRLASKCNAPANQIGVYMVYELKKGRIEIVYIGHSGKLLKEEQNGDQPAVNKGLKEVIINGLQPGGVSRSISWPLQMQMDGIEALDVYWYVTQGKDYKDCPQQLERKLIKKYSMIYGHKPRWNEEKL